MNINPLFETIIRHCKAYPDRDSEALQFQVSTLGYDDYIGRLGIGRITRGRIHEGQTVSVCRTDGSIVQRKINQVFVYRGLRRTAVSEQGAEILLLFREFQYFYRRDYLR